MPIKKLTCITIIITLISFSCGGKNKRDSDLFAPSPAMGLYKWSFDDHGRLQIPSKAISDFYGHGFGDSITGPEILVTPGPQKEPGTKDGNCHGGGCSSGRDGGGGQDNIGGPGEFDGGRGGGGGGGDHWSSGEGKESGGGKGNPMVIGLLLVPFQIAQAVYNKLDVLSQDLGVVMGDTVGSVFGASSRHDRNMKAKKIRAEMEAEKKKLEDEIAKQGETQKWIAEEVKRAIEDSISETKQVELDHAIKEAQSHVDRLKEQVRTTGKAELYLERGNQYSNDLNQSMIEAAKRHNESLDEFIGAIPDSWSPTTEVSEAAQLGQALPHTPEGRKIAETRGYLRFVENEVERNPVLRDEKRHLVRIADQSLTVASEEFGSGNFPAGDFALNIATAALDLALSLTPGIGLGKDIYEGVTGKNLLTGDKLSTIERALSFVSAATGGMVPVVMKATVGISIIVKVAKRSAKTAEEAEELLKIAEKARDVVDSAKKFGAKTAEETKDFIQTAEGVLGKDIATAGKLENLVDTASALAKDLKFTETTAKRMEDAARYVPRETLSEAIKFGKKMPDPQGAAGAERYVIDMFKNGKKYELEVVYRESDNTILHFLYK